MNELFLSTGDVVGISFFIATAMMLAATVFFILERQNVSKKWKTSLTIASLVTGVAFWHYLYMKKMWVATSVSPTLFRYVDWFITVPLQMVEFYLIVAAVAIVRVSVFWKMLISSLIMLLGGFLGEAGLVNETAGFTVGFLAWLYIIYEIFVGEASQANKASGNKASQHAFNTIKWIVTIGWSIYPIGYVLGYLTNTANVDTLNIIYNLADLVNKVAFGVAIWYAAKLDSKSEA